MNQAGKLNNNFRHGKSLSPTWIGWRSMRSRCYQKSNPQYHRYGGAGIKVCQSWDDFSNFLSDMGERPDGMTIDRIDGQGNYEPGNCRWATPKKQAQNRRSSIVLTINGVTKTASEFCEDIGLNRATAYDRIYRGWNPEKAVTTPAHG